jgi:pimeloyl-ACP methyl ester carboxylesterase
VPRGRSRSHGVVLCPPAPQEYMRSHMALRKLATQLAREGFHVLRFDYYATGDSGGKSENGSLSQWRQNIVAAFEDLRACSGVKKVSAIGFRLGAALAASAPADVVNLILWEPVVNGTAYIEELRTLHRRQYAPLLFPPPLPPRGAGGDILGSPFSAAMEADLQTVDLVSQPPARAEHVALVVSDERPEYGELRERFRNASAPGTSLEYCHIPAEPQLDHQEAMLVSSRLLQTMVGVLTKGAA